MSIGQDLAEARRQAGLSLSQVSQQTCIRETIIREIERDEYSACGGDFYARGHIRSIAQAVGTDPAPLIQQYDAARRGQPPARAAELLGPVRPIEFRPRRRRWPGVAALLLAAAAAAAYYGLGTPHQAPRAAARAGTVSHRSLSPSAPAAAPSTPAAAAATAAPQPYAQLVAVRLAAVQDCWVEFTTPGGGYLQQAYLTAGTVKTWTFRHPVDMRVGNPSGVRLTVDGKHPLPHGQVSPVTLHLGPGGRVSSG